MLSILLNFSVLAQQPLPSSPATNLPESGFIAAFINEVLPYVFGIAGFVAVIMIIVSGIQFMTSSGNPEAAAAARGRLIFALIGFGLIVLSYIVLRLVDQLFLGNVIT